MFIPLRKTGQLFTTGKKNVYGDREYSKEATPFGWAPIYMRDNLTDSSVRADSSASRGRAEETLIDYRLIIEKTVTPQKGDKIVLDGNKSMIVLRVHERMDMRGLLHHWEVDCGSA
ncbi:hypothetical protein JCM19235_1247 [Vibrio maritimus]|uniref:Phage protein n=1 Tax=Vibrio maritimus TaxID=990268 RepID=A0A090S5Y4_9VIBR|nr:hypothetical protein JCM19235_1247 [Vibrio maritimus]